MEALKTLLESLKATTYEMAALLLPGAAVLFSMLSVLDLPFPGGAIVDIGGAYALGLALQGISDFSFRRWPLNRLVAQAHTPDWHEMRKYALSLIKKNLDDKVPDVAALDICLTSVQTHRNLYDKFIALRDTARGLAIGLVPVTACVLYKNWDTLTSGMLAVAICKVIAVAATSLVLFLGFIGRYVRFHPLAPQVVYGQFIATQMTAQIGSTSKPTDSTHATVSSSESGKLWTRSVVAN